MEYSKQPKENKTKVCPKTGKPIQHKRNNRWVKWLFPITGLVALIWFLIRVIPKPSRALYPCQRIAQPLASGFVVWLLGLIASAVAYRKARRLFLRSRYVVGAAMIVVAVAVIFFPLCLTAGKNANAAFVPTDPPNSPIGVAKGINPAAVTVLLSAAVVSRSRRNALSKNKAKIH